MKTSRLLETNTENSFNRHFPDTLWLVSLSVSQFPSSTLSRSQSIGHQFGQWISKFRTNKCSYAVLHWGSLSLVFQRQSVNESVNLSVRQVVSRCPFVSPSISQSFSRSVGWSVSPNVLEFGSPYVLEFGSPYVRKPIRQSVSKFVRPPCRQFVNTLVSQSFSISVRKCVSLFLL